MDEREIRGGGPTGEIHRRPPEEIRGELARGGEELAERKMREKIFFLLFFLKIVVLCLNSKLMHIYICIIVYRIRTINFIFLLIHNKLSAPNSNPSGKKKNLTLATSSF